MDKEIEDAIQQALRPFSNDEVAAFSCYSSCAVFFDVFEPPFFEDLESFRTHWQTLDPNADQQIAPDVRELRFMASGDIAFCACLLQFPNSGGFVNDQALLRATFCLRKRDGRWLIEHQHISEALEDSDI